MNAAADKLRALAKAATPGPWRVDADEVQVFALSRLDTPRLPSTLPLTLADADYIAAMSPEVALALLDSLEAAYNTLIVLRSREFEPGVQMGSPTLELAGDRMEPARGSRHRRPRPTGGNR